MANQEIFFDDDKFIVSKTDLKGRITYGNSLFIQISGYSESELINAPHNILRHEDMPAVVFKLLWDQIKLGHEIFAYVKNKTKDGNFYWVFAHVTPSFDLQRNISSFHSVRRKPKKESLDVIRPLYTQLLRIEKSSGVEASKNALDTILKDKGVSYDEFILSI